ncbi:MAG: FAD:protein FMN transferase [Clostridiales bacterium]|nr:FAD:protein FMN transferase [Clostridiales bacterium]
MLKRVVAVLAALIVCMSFTGCAKKETKSVSFFAMDTFITISVTGDDAKATLDWAKNLVETNEQKWSATLPDSLISRLNAGEKITPDADTARILERAAQMRDYTLGAFEPAVYPLVRAWGFTTGEYRIPSDSEIEELLGQVLKDSVRRDGGQTYLAGGMIDLGGIAKGMTGDMLLAGFRERGVASALINLGGNVQALGAKPDGSAWKIGIQSPYDDSVIGVVSIKNKCVITSGAYERYFLGEDGQVYGHIISPFTGRPVSNGVVSVSVIADEGAEADALSTALFVMGEHEALDFWRTHEGFDVILLTDSGTLYVTEGIWKDFTERSSLAVKQVCEIKR